METIPFTCFLDFSLIILLQSVTERKRKIGGGLVTGYITLDPPDPIHTESEVWRKIAGAALFLVQRLGRGAEGGSARIVLMGPGLLK